MVFTCCGNLEAGGTPWSLGTSTCGAATHVSGPVACHQCPSCLSLTLYRQAPHSPPGVLAEVRHFPAGARHKLVRTI